MTLPAEMLAVGVTDKVGVRLTVAVGLAVGVGEGISIIVGVGVGVMVVFCCSRVLVMSASCLRRTADWEYIKIEAEIPTPARRRRMIVNRDEVGAAGRFVGIVAGCKSAFGEGGGSVGVVGVGRDGGIGSSSFNRSSGSLGAKGVVGWPSVFLDVGSSSGVGSNSGGFGVLLSGVIVELLCELWSSDEDSGLGKFP